MIAKLVLFVLIIRDFVEPTDDRIVGGRPAHVGEIPYQVSLRKSYNDKHFCGGVVVSSKHILTAAHCMYYIWGGILPPIVVSAVFGQLDLPITEKSVYRNASSIVINPSFNKTTMANDLAIIELTEELPIGETPLINIIELRKNKIQAGDCFVSGWGVEEYNSTIISEELLLAEVSIVDFETCQEMYTENVTLFDGMLCAGHVNGTTDACQGDSGGPLVCNGLLTGLVSTGSGCGSAEYPGIYTEISTYYNWIVNMTTLSRLPFATKEWRPYEENEFLNNKYVQNHSEGMSKGANGLMLVLVALQCILFNNT